MEEILYELRDHSAGLNARPWDHIFSGGFDGSCVVVGDDFAGFLTLPAEERMP